MLGQMYVHDVWCESFWDTYAAIQTVITVILSLTRVNVSHHGYAARSIKGFAWNLQRGLKQYTSKIFYCEKVLNESQCLA